MKKRVLVLFFICSVSLTACLEKSIAEEESKNELLIVDQQIRTKQTVNKSTSIDKTKDIMINIVDPNTSQVIKTFSPKDYGVETNEKTYVENIKILAKELARGTEQNPGYDQRMKQDRIDANGQIIKGKPMIILNEQELVDKLVEASTTGEEVQLPLSIATSDYNLEEIATFEEATIASYTTYFNASEIGRNKNIELSAKALNNVIVGNEDRFSFNTMVGPRDEENGYQPAPEIVNKKLVMGIGGGICQTSSTLFNAVDQLPVEYIERHRHSLNIGYVPKGRDATVSYGTLDFRFQNTSGIPFLIKTKYGKDYLTIEIRTSKKYKKNLTEK